MKKRASKIANMPIDTALIPQNSRVLCALSGGGDSVALLHWLKSRGVCVFAAHLNHGIRGSTAIRDQQFCQELCQGLGVPFFTETVSCPKIAAEKKQSMELCAREQRYEFLERSRAHFDCELIAVAHHQNDRAETILLNLFRGTGPSGITSMKKNRGNIVRPLLDVTRDDIMDYIAENNLSYVTDETNENTDYTRNLLRSLDSSLKSINSAYAANLCRAAELISRDEDALMSIAETALSSARSNGGLNAAVLAGLHPAVATRVIRSFAAENGVVTDLSLSHVDSIMSILTETEQKRVSLPRGYRAEICRGILSMYPPASGTLDYLVPINPAGGTDTPQGVITIVPCEGGSATSNAFECIMPAEKVTGAVARLRRPGDRLTPFNSQGSKKLKELYIDKKLTAAEKTLPVVEKDGEILWAVGAGAAEGCRVLPGQAAVKLQFKYF